MSRGALWLMLRRNARASPNLQRVKNVEVLSSLSNQAVMAMPERDAKCQKPLVSWRSKLREQS